MDSAYSRSAAEPPSMPAAASAKLNRSRTSSATPWVLVGDRAQHRTRDAGEHHPVRGLQRDPLGAVTDGAVQQVPAPRLDRVPQPALVRDAHRAQLYVD